MRLKIYVLFYNLLQEISLNLVIVDFKLDRKRVFSFLARLVLTDAQYMATTLMESDLWLLLHLGKRMTAKKYQSNPWTYQSTLEEKICTKVYSRASLQARLLYMKLNKIAATERSKTNQTPIWRLTIHGQDVLEAVNYIQWKCPELHE